MAYSQQRIRAYFPLRNRVEFVELNSDSQLTVCESLNAQRLEDRLRHGFYRHLLCVI